MADKEIKFTDEELKELAGIQTGYNNLQTQMGQTRMQIIGAKKQLEALEDSIIFETSTQDKIEDSYRVWKGNSQK